MLLLLVVYLTDEHGNIHGITCSAILRRNITNNWHLINFNVLSIILMEPTTVGSLWLENDLHENELEFESYMGRSKKNVRVTSDGIHAEIHEI